MLKSVSTLMIILLMSCLSLSCFAARTFVGNNPINEVMIVESSSFCGPTNGACLLLYFEGGAQGCSPSSSYLAFRLDEPNFKTIEAMAYISLTAKKKFRTYGEATSCKDADLLNPNGASVYDVAH